MSFLDGILSDPRDKRLLAVAVAVLAAAVVAVPLLLSKGGKSTPMAQLPATPQPATPAGLPVVNTGSAPTGGKLTGHARDPFTQLVHAATAGTTIGTTAGTASGASTTPTSGTSTTSSSTTSSSTSSTSTIAPTTTITTATPKPAPPGLTSIQSYDVKLAITNSSGGLDTINPLERLSVLPSTHQPLLVELGVLKGGSRALFAVEPGAVIGGPGKCIPGPIDCEILSLGQDQTEALGQQTSGGVASVALFAVTGITAAGHSSVAAANQARQAASVAGRRLLSNSTSSVLPLFQYESSLGAVVDQRNLVIGGN
jgi:hypothetical protein